ncbi:hypothetical protein AVEN_224915-1 [Araneus ventricosus]|uniref:THAP-type domain-containing protein n=1 Tax=Araneus ventricosus TaxID=182803 RepID=A0A4Y2R7W4_ARAVE|nr:hypothetical protein AVEN_224915-1 [Araneus ventricosus]
MSDIGKPYFKYCLVPCCTNTTITAPDKLFFSVPKDRSKRDSWTEAMKRDRKKNPALSTKSIHWCCEDHFSLEEDLENYWQWKLMGNVKRLKLKAGVVPHIFECQKKTLSTPVQKGALKRKRIALVQAALSAVNEPSSSFESEPSASTSFEEPSSSNFDEDPNLKDKCIQVNIVKHFRSKATNTHVPNTSVACSPIKISVMPQNGFPHKLYSTSQPDAFKIGEEETVSSDSADDFHCPSDSSENYSSENENINLEKYHEHMLKGTLMSIEKNPRLFLGLPIRSYFLIQLITETVPLPTRNIYIVLKKLRLDNQFSILAIDFGLCESTVSRVFKKSVPMLAQLMQDLIVWPSLQDIRKHLPIPFRARYSKVISIIDCLEIEIEKPSNPVHQALTWSRYYNCNTLKFLLSCTPDGLVSFISEGYGGRTSDIMIVEHSGYLEKLVSGTSVMADRGFKHISSLLMQKGSELVRPPSVSSASISSKADVKLSKRIASLRIHVERVIGRLREFRMLAPHSCLDNHLIRYLDYIIIIACGLINMQEHLIKKQV